MAAGAAGPRRFPVLPLRDVVFFPRLAMPLLVGRGASLAAGAVSAVLFAFAFLAASSRARTALAISAANSLPASGISSKKTSKTEPSG